MGQTASTNKWVCEKDSIHCESKSGEDLDFSDCQGTPTTSSCVNHFKKIPAKATCNYNGYDGCCGPCELVTDEAKATWQTESYTAGFLTGDLYGCSGVWCDAASIIEVKLDPEIACTSDTECTNLPDLENINGVKCVPPAGCDGTHGCTQSTERGHCPKGQCCGGYTEENCGSGGCYCTKNEGGEDNKGFCVGTTTHCCNQKLCQILDTIGSIVIAATMDVVTEGDALPGQVANFACKTALNLSGAFNGLTACEKAAAQSTCAAASLSIGGIASDGLNLACACGID
jgi:hypothetical protein